MYLKSSNQSSMQSSRPSVPSMRTLKPLTLLSPPIPTVSEWPLLNSAQGSPQGFSTLPHVPRSSTRKDSLENYQLWCNRSSVRQSNQYRDTPIYNEPGSPLPADAGFTGNDLGLHDSRALSMSDENLTSRIYSSQSESHPVFEDSNFDESDETSRTSYVQSTRPNSDLSFQCHGEIPIQSEGQWSERSPQQRERLFSLTDMPQLLGNTTLDDSVESWLSEASSDQEDEFLAYATVLKPTKASIVECSSPLSASGRTRAGSTTSYRSQSSLLWPGTPTRRSNQLNETPPVSPDINLASKKVFEQTNHKRKPKGRLPRRRLDLAMPSPPVSPDDFPESPVYMFPSPTGMSRDPRFEIAEESRNSALSSKSDWPLPSPKSEGDIISNLEDCISTFPYTMLDLHSPVIEDIRSYSLTSSRRSLEVHDAPDSFFPEMAPLCRIFPGSSPTQQSALYAHILAHLHIENLLQFDQTPSPLETRRHTPYWPNSPTRIASLATLSAFGSPPPKTEPSSHKSKRRLRGLQKDVQRCIQSLVRKMEDPTDEDDRLESKINITTLRMLEEIVRSSESQIFGYS